MLDATSFIEKFHGLTGKLLRDRKKALYNLFENYRSIENDEKILKEINAKLQPNTYLEETYKLEFLLYFKRVWELYDLLKCGNDKAACKIIKQKWFVTTILKDVTPEKFITEIFPQLSLVIRLKMLKQILKYFSDEKFFDSLFQELIETYGLIPALVIISGCSVEKIQDVLTERGLKISMAQLKLLHDKDRSLIVFYYEEYYQRGGNMDSLDPFTRYLSRKDPNLFMELRIKYQFISKSYQLGREATNCYVEENKESIMRDPLKYLDLKVLKESALVRQLGDDFPRFLKAAFPASMNQLNRGHIVFNLLDQYPKTERYNLFSCLFKEVYNKDLIASKQIMPEKLLKFIPSLEDREKWVKDVFCNEIKYIQYKRSTLAIPELKEQLFRADVVTIRREIFEYIITSCGINEDYDSLLDILKLVCRRFRNDEAALYSVVNKIRENMDLHRLTEEHWKYIYEIMLMQDLNNMFVNGEMVMEYSKSLYKSGSSFKDVIPLCIKSEEITSILSWKFVDSKFLDENFQKIFLKCILSQYPNIDKKHRSSWKTMKLVLLIKRWNENHPNDIISFLQEKSIVEIMRDEVKWNRSYCPLDQIQVLTYLICSRNDSYDFGDLYFENIRNLSNYTITRWFLKNKPEVFEKHIDKVHACFNAKAKNLTRILRKLEYLGLVKAIEDHYLEELEKPGQTEKDMIAQLLASVMPTKNFLELLGKYIPTIDKIDLLKASEEQKSLLRLERALAQSVRFTSYHTAALPIIFNYCRGDCLQPALYSLYSCFSRIPEKDLEPYLPKLLNKPVSLRKHAIFLAVLMFPLCTNGELGEELMKNEKDLSVQKHHFISCYKFFLKNPLDQFWNILVKYMNSLTLFDEQSLDLLTNIHTIPVKYKGIFAEKVWKMLEELERKEKIAVNKYYTNFFLTICDHDVRFLASTFCTEIINKKLFEGGYKRDTICSKFACQYMMYCKNIKQAVENVMKILSKYKMKYWNSENSAYAKSAVYHFCLEVFEKGMGTNYLRLILPQEFSLILSEEWKNVFIQEETFEEYLMLEFMLLKYEATEASMDLEVIAHKIREIFESLRSSYGNLVLDLFRDFLITALKQLLGSEKYDLKLLELLKYLAQEDNISSTCCLLIISLLPICPQGDNSKKNYDYVMKKIRSNPDPIISISLDKHFKTSM